MKSSGQQLTFLELPHAQSRVTVTIRVSRLPFTVEETDVMNENKFPRVVGTCTRMALCLPLGLQWVPFTRTTESLKFNPDSELV